MCMCAAYLFYFHHALLTEKLQAAPCRHAATLHEHLRMNLPDLTPSSRNITASSASIRRPPNGCASRRHCATGCVASSTSEIHIFNNFSERCLWAAAVQTPKQSLRSAWYVRARDDKSIIPQEDLDGEAIGLLRMHRVRIFFVAFCFVECQPLKQAL